MENQWQDNLRKRMEAHQEPPPDGLWADIEQIAIAESIAQTPPKHKKTLLWWGKRAGTAAAVAAILLMVGRLALNRNEDAPRYAEQGVSASVSAEKSETPTAAVTQPAVQLFSEKRKTSKSARKTVSFTADSVALAVANPSPESEKKSETAANSAPQPKENQDIDSHNLNTAAHTQFSLPAHRRKHKRANWQTNLYAANAPTRSTKSYEGYRALFVPAETHDGEAPVVASDLARSVLLQNQYREVYTDIKHLQPIMLGVSLRYNVTEKWGLSSGLTYTVLTSQLRSGNADYFYNSEQTLHYVGIPVNVDYTVWRNNRVSTYVSAGALAEKNVAGSLTTNYYIDNKMTSRTHDKLMDKRLQFSVNSALGIEYQLSKIVGIYAEPGVSYHFKNNNGLETVYNHRPLNFNLKLGLRFSLSD